MATKRLSRWQLILKAVYYEWKKRKENDREFAWGDVIVLAWKTYPKTFGLEGYEYQHPDAKDISSYLMGDRGLVKNNMFQKVRQKVYKISPRGLAHAKWLCGETPDINENSQIEEQDIAILNEEDSWLLENAWNEKFFSERRDQTTEKYKSNMIPNLMDAMQFWGLSKKEQENFHKHINKVSDVIQKYDENKYLRISKDVLLSPSDVKKILQHDEVLKDRMKGLIKLMENRESRS